jgi:ADP-ribosylation factor-like protein 1
MGNLFGKIFSRLWSKKELKIIIIGLDNSGKTTILSTQITIKINFTSIKSSKLYQVTQVICSNWLQYGSSAIQESTVSGLGPRRAKFHQVPLRPHRQYWEMYYPNTNAILYVVDSHDRQRFSKAAE